MDSDYGCSSAEESYGGGSEEDDFDFDSQAEVETTAKKVIPRTDLEMRSCVCTSAESQHWGFQEHWLTQGCGLPGSLRRVQREAAEGAAAGGHRCHCWDTVYP